MPQALRLGYATAGTDTGHQEPGGDWAIGHPEKMVDFGYRATHEMTLKAKQIVKAFYERSAKYSYFKGCSTGGRMALMEAQRYPDDYDGIIAGSLANRHIHMWTAGVARSIELSRHPEGSLSTEKAALVNQTGDEHVRHAQGRVPEQSARSAKWTSRSCCAQRGKDDAACLTAAQLKTVNTFYGGVKNSKGELIFSGQALGNPIGALRATNQSPGGTFDIVRIALNDPNLDWQKFDLDRDMPLIDKAVGYVDAVNPDLEQVQEERRQAAAYARLGRHRHHAGNHDLVLRVRARQDGQESERLGAPVHGAWHGPLRRRPRRQYVRLDRHAREMGGKRHRARANAGDGRERSHASALPVSAVCGVQGNRRLEGRRELGLQSAEVGLLPLPASRPVQHDRQRVRDLRRRLKGHEKLLAVGRGHKRARSGSGADEPHRTTCDVEQCARNTRLERRRRTPVHGQLLSSRAFCGVHDSLALGHA